MTYLFHTLLTIPIFNLLVVLYKYVAFQDLGFAIILLTIVIRVVLYPLFYKSFRNQTIMQKVQPEIARVQQQHKGNKEEQAKAALALYKQYKVNPFSSFFFVLLQLPLLIAVYQVFSVGFTTEAFSQLYSFVSAPAVINNTLFGFMDITQPSWMIVIFAVIAQFLQSWLALPKTKPGQQPDKNAKMAKNMAYIAPLLTILILPKLPAAVGIYWCITSLFSVGQQYAINKTISKEEAGKTA